MDANDYLRALKRRWLIIVAAVVIALPLAWVTSNVVVPAGPQVKNYKATTVLLTLSDLPNSSGVSNLQTLAALVTIPTIAQRVAADIHWEGDPSELSSYAQAAADTQTGLLRISATTQDGPQAALMADSFASELLAFITERQQATLSQEAKAISDRVAELKVQIRDIDAQIAASTGSPRTLLESQRTAMEQSYAALVSQFQQITASSPQTTGLVIIQDAVPVLLPPVGLQAPQSRRTRILIAVLVALFGGVAVALVVERFDTRIRTKEMAEEKYRFPVLAEVPLVPRWHRPKEILPAISQPHSKHADAFRLLCITVTRPMSVDGNGNGSGRSFAAGPTSPQTVLVTSAGPSEGKSTVVANLAATYAQLGRRVVVLSCDFRHPRIHDLLGVPEAANEPGLAEALASTSEGPVLSGHLLKTRLDDVRLVASGAPPQRPGKLLSSPTMRRALQEAKQEADVVIIDTPPILASADATHLLREVDRVLVVSRAGRTRSELAERASELLTRLGAPVSGVVLNGAKEAPLPKGYYRYASTTLNGSGRILGRRGKPTLVRHHEGE